MTTPMNCGESRVGPSQSGGKLHISVGERHVLLEGLSGLDFGFARDVEEKLRATCCSGCCGSGFAPYVGGDDDEDPCDRCQGSGWAGDSA